jgi:hypothetical protein
MKCCSGCFQSAEIKYLIESKQALSQCDLCGQVAVPCVDARELIFNFTPLLDLYDTSEHGRPLENRLLSDFPDSIFSNLDEERVKRLLDAIFADDADATSKYLGQPVVLACEEDGERKEEITKLVTTWERFCNEIKTENRFHIKNSLDLDRLRTLLSVIESNVPAGRILYRARICAEDGLTAGDMGQPPRSKARGGRANPEGISYLYLASDEATAIHEVRAGLLDYVCVGEFQLKEAISIIDLMDIGKKDPFAFVGTLEGSSALENFIAFRPFLSKLGEELSRPLRPSDSELDYIPTQYLTEFIKSQGYAGVRYGSAQRPNGHNFAIFNPEKFECIRINLKEVDRIDLSIKAVRVEGSDATN